MLRETSICSTVVAIGVLLLGFGLGWEIAVIGTVALIVAALPFFASTVLQIGVLRAIAQAKANSFLGRDFTRSPAVVVEQPRQVENPRRPAVEPPQAERVRLLPVFSNIDSVKMASEFTLHTGEIVRAVHVVTPKLIDDCDELDLIEFIDQLSFRGHSKRGWLGVRLPSGRVCDEPYYNLLVAPLVKIGAIVDRGPRRAGKLVLNASEIKARLGLAELSPVTVIDAKMEYSATATA